MPSRLSSFIPAPALLLALLSGVCGLPSAPCMAKNAFAGHQEPPQLEQPWELRARPQADSGGLSVLSDVSSGSTSSIVNRVISIRTAFSPLFAGIPRAISQAPGVLVFSDSEEMIFTLRTRLAVSSIPDAPALSFFNESGQFIAVAVDRTNALAFDRALQASALEQMLVPLFLDRLPPWARIGLVQYAGSLDWRGDRIATGQSASGLRDALLSSSGDTQLIPIDRLLQLDAAEWSAFERRGGALRMQANAWLMVHFLIHGEGGRLVPFFRDWLHAVAIGRDSERDLAARLMPVFSLESFEEARRDHLVSQGSGDVELFREQAEVLRILMQELEDSGIRPGDRGALQVELALLEDRDIDLHRSPFVRTVHYPGTSFFDPCIINSIPFISARNTKDPPALPAPMGLELVHPSGESVRVEWIRVQGAWRSFVAW